MQIACYLATAIFGLFTYWQFNDLEQYGTQFWYGWVLAYGVVCQNSADRNPKRIRPFVSLAIRH